MCFVLLELRYALASNQSRVDDICRSDLHFIVGVIIRRTDPTLASQRHTFGIYLAKIGFFDIEILTRYSSEAKHELLTRTTLREHKILISNCWYLQCGKWNCDSQLAACIDRTPTPRSPTILLDWYGYYNITPENIDESHVVNFISRLYGVLKIHL